MKMKALHALLLAAAGLVTAAPAAAQAPSGPIGISPTGQPRNYAMTFRPYQLQGYGRARFGMTPDEVKAVIAADYAGASAPKEDIDRVTRTRTLVVMVPTLAPGPGPATLSFVFGAQSQRLAAINVYWIAPGEATAQQREAIIAAGSQVLAGLVGSYWAPMSTARGHVLAPGVVILFASRDAAGHGIEVRLDGVPLAVQRPARDGKPRPLERMPAPPGPARLRLAISADPDHPDVFRLPAGSF